MDYFPYLVGVAMGDGYLDKVSFRLRVNDKDFADAVAQALQNQFGKVARYTVIDRGRPTHAVALHSKTGKMEIARRCNRSWIQSLSSDQKVAWIRGLWDSDGSICYQTNGYGFRIRLGVEEKWLAELYRKLLYETSGIRGRLSNQKIRSGKLFWTVTFARLEDVVKFYTTVQPTIRRKRERFIVATKTTKGEGRIS